jgi:membrane-bound lytic murein transglycosylase B
MRKVCTALTACVVLAVAAPALAADCGNGSAGFGAWLNRFADYAASQGVSNRALDAGGLLLGDEVELDISIEAVRS